MMDYQMSGNREPIDKKLQHANESMEVIEKIEPGLSSIKGKLISY